MIITYMHYYPPYNPIGTAADMTKCAHCFCSHNTAGQKICCLCRYTPPSSSTVLNWR